MSRDLVSENLQHKTHYNSFATHFFIRLNEFLLLQAQIRDQERYLYSELKCWRCGPVLAICVVKGALGSRAYGIEDRIVAETQAADTQYFRVAGFWNHRGEVGCVVL